MTEEELAKKLNSVGEAVFVEYFDDFDSYWKGLISKDQCVNKLVSNKVSNENGAIIRCNYAKQIFEESMECRAIGMICRKWGETRLNANTIDAATHILQRCP